MSNKKHWLTKIAPVLAFTAGIIMASVGGIITISSTAKLVLFEKDSYSYVSREECRMNYNNQGIDGEIQKPRVQTDGEIDLCVAERKSQETERFQNSEKQDIVDGLTPLIVGFILILFFRRKK